MFSHNVISIKKFLVFGAHSITPTHAYYKEILEPTPFINSSVKKLHINSFNKIQQDKKQETIKKIEKKQKVSVVKKKHAFPQKKSTSSPTTLRTFKKITLKSKEKAITQKKELLKEIKLEIPCLTKETSIKKIKQTKISPPPSLDTPACTGTRDRPTLPPSSPLSPSSSSNYKTQDHEIIEARFSHHQKDIQNEISRLWRPPVGVSKGTECSVMFVVEKEGLVKRFEILHKSSVPIYDLSIVRVAKNFMFDKCLWGKTFVVNFLQ
jgi:hypothetical protein